MNYKKTSSAELTMMRSGAVRSSKRSNNTLAEKRIEGEENGAQRIANKGGYEG